ncbi:MAG: hypothetical protein WB820_22765 [Rhodoplanes sp.]
MRARLIALLAAGATIVVASPGMAQDWQALQSRQIAAAIAPLSQLAEQIPDGAELIDLYKAARTVADVEAANSKVRGEVGRAQSVASDLGRLHAVKMTVCEDVEQSHLEMSMTNARSLSATLARIDGELTKSLTVMRQRVLADRLASTRAKDDVNRYTVAVHELSRLNVQTQELAKAIHGVARNIRTLAASCLPTSIPPPFAEASSQSSSVISVTRPRPRPRRRPANALTKRPPLFFRY